MRTWTLTVTATTGPGRGMTLQEGPYTDKAKARTRAEKLATEHNNPVRVSTRGHFGSFTVPAPDGRIVP